MGQIPWFEGFTTIQELLKVFLTVVGCKTTEDPVFSQHISHNIFVQSMKETFPLPDSCGISETYYKSLALEEINAIRYVAGYVCSKLYKKLKKSSAANKDDLCQGIVDMMEDEMDEGDASSSWTDINDRGGLFKVGDMAYAFFVSVELVARKYYQLKKAGDLQPGVKDLLVTSALEDDDVQLQWSSIGVELSEKDQGTLLHMIINLWMNIRGFSFAGAYVEIYKQATKKSLQKTMSTTYQVERGQEERQENRQETLDSVD